MRLYLTIAMAAALIASVALNFAQYRDAAATAATVARDAATAQAAAVTDARKAEQAMAELHAEIAESYEKGKTDAQVTADRVVADLNAGALRLQRRWASCETSRLSEAAATAAQPDAGSDDRAASASRIVRAAAAADAQIAALQALVRSDREALR